MSAQVLAVRYFLYVPPHLKHISKGSSQYVQYCEWKNVLFHHLRFITHDSLACTGGLKKKTVEGKKDTHKKDVDLKVVTCQQRGNGINISAVHLFFFCCGGGGGGGVPIPVFRDCLPLMCESAVIPFAPVRPVLTPG